MKKLAIATALLVQIAAIPVLAQTREPSPEGTPVATPAPAPTPVKPAPTPTPVKSAPAPISADPQFTAANYGDWTLRCHRTPTNTKFCEIVTSISGNNGQQKFPIAELAFGRPGKTDPVHLTAHVPSNIVLPSVAKFTANAKDSSAKPIDIPWMRCMPNGCYADMLLNDLQLKAIHSQTEQGSLEFLDSGNHDVKFIISLAGLPQAMDAMSREF